MVMLREPLKYIENIQNFLHENRFDQSFEFGT